MRVTSKGQVTVPKDLRERAGIGPGSEVTFGFANGVITLAKAASGRPGPTPGERVVEALRGSRTANCELSTDEIMKVMRPRD